MVSRVNGWFRYTITKQSRRIKFLCKELDMSLTYINNTFHQMIKC